jgi:hypothetical protein
MNLHKYKNILGIPKKGIHSYRICNIAIMDVIMTILMAYLIKQFFNISFSKTAILLFSIGIILHRLFGVKTTIDLLLFD